MGDKIEKYIGVERRSLVSSTRRKPGSKTPVKFLGMPGGQDISLSSHNHPNAGPGLEMPGRGIVELKEHMPPLMEKRIGGARRSGDLARALETGEDIAIDIGKLGKLGKLAKKAGKHLPVIGVAAGIYDLVNRASKK